MDHHDHPNPLFRRMERSTPVKVDSSELKCNSSYGEGLCGSASNCANWFEVITADPSFKCKFPAGRDGYCCPTTIPNLLRNKFAVFEAPVLRAAKIESFGYDEVKVASDEAQKIYQELSEKEKRWQESDFYVKNDQPAFHHAQFFTAKSQTYDEGRKAFTALLAAKNLAKKYKLTVQEAWGLRQFSVLDTSFKDTCRGNITCDRRAFYRTMDGSCNNFEHVLWGKANTPFTRLRPPAYEDGVIEPRTMSVTGVKLPSARKVSSSFEPGKDRPLNGITLLTIIFGQFLDHDVMQGALFSGPNGERIPCCTKDGKFFTDVKDMHPACFPIRLPDDDPFYSKFGKVCMEFVRALPSPNLDCTLGFAHQVNQQTQVIDASMVYGVTEEESKGLRAKGGKLIVTNIRGFPEPLLPQVRDKKEDDCGDKEKELFCFKAGDSRVNEQIALTIVHTIFMREHNRLVDVLSELNPQWDDERLFQEARRIVAAEIQHITYNEFLPLIIGPKAMYEYGITPMPEGYFRDYDETVNPSVTSEFNIAFRFGHSMLQGIHQLITDRYSVVGEVRLRTFLDNPLSLYRKGYLEDLLRGLITQKSQSFDTSFTEEVQRHLFERKDQGHGLDLLSLNIQRGRDLALPSYNEYREFCNKDRAKDFSDLLDIMDERDVDILRSVYKHVDDIDIFPGGVAEKPVRGGIVGPTFQCIIADQFARLKKGDRFFYDLGGQQHSFSPLQLREIRKVTLARLICDNVKGMKRLQPLVFYEASNLNNIVPCDHYMIPEMDLFGGWKDHK